MEGVQSCEGAPVAGPLPVKAVRAAPVGSQHPARGGWWCWWLLGAFSQHAAAATTSHLRLYYPIVAVRLPLRRHVHPMRRQQHRAAALAATPAPTFIAVAVTVSCGFRCSCTRRGRTVFVT